MADVSFPKLLSNDCHWTSQMIYQHGPGNGLVPSGNISLPKPILFQFYVAMWRHWATYHYDDVIMCAMASQITNFTIVYSTVYSDADQRKHQSSASLAFVRGIHRGPVNSPHKWPVTRKMFPFYDVIMYYHNLSDSRAFSVGCNYSSTVILSRAPFY